VKAVVIEEDRSVVVRDDVPEPEPAEGERVLEVRAAGINFLEALVRQGRYPQPPPLPWIPGAEVAGELDDEPWLALKRQSGGGWAERAAVEEEWLFPLPAGAGWAEGASFLMTFLTAWIPLTRQVSLRPGTRVLVTAAAGGVGSAAVQVVRALGAQACAAVGSERKKTVPVSLGADPVVTYDELEEVGRVDVVFDPVGGELLTRCLGLLKPLGTAIAIGFAGGPWEPLDTARLVGRNSGLAGFYLGRLIQLEPQTVKVAAGDVLGLWKQGVVHPVVGARFPLIQAAAALDFIESRDSTGKVVLIP
jgi:NADPH2:quinone reductase